MKEFWLDGMVLVVGGVVFFTLVLLLLPVALLAFILFPRLREESFKREEEIAKRESYKDIYLPSGF